MAEKRRYGRIVQKHDLEKNWKRAKNFIPMAAEVIVYDRDENYDYPRIKIGDGVQNVNALPFVDDNLRIQLVAQIGDVDDKVDAVSALVGDESVSEQINTAIKNNPSSSASKHTTVTMAVANWRENDNNWSQAVNVTGVTANTKVDLQANVEQIISLQEDETVLFAENNNGIVTVRAIGNKPTVDYTMQAILTEVVPV